MNLDVRLSSPRRTRGDDRAPGADRDCLEVGGVVGHRLVEASYVDSAVLWLRFRGGQKGAVNSLFVDVFHELDLRRLDHSTKVVSSSFDTQGSNQPQTARMRLWTRVRDQHYQLAYCSQSGTRII